MARWVRVPINIDGAGSGGQCTNVWTFGVPAEGSPSSPELALAMDELETFYDAISALYPSTAQINSSVGYVYDDNVLTSIVSLEDAVDLVGTGAGGGGGPDGLSLIVRWRTALPSRSGRGRTFIGPLSLGVSQSNEPTTAALTPLSVAASDLVAASLANEGWDLQVYSPTDGVSREVIASDVNPEFGYLRSRRT